MFNEENTLPLQCLTTSVDVFESNPTSMSKDFGTFIPVLSAVRLVESASQICE